MGIKTFVENLIEDQKGIAVINLLEGIGEPEIIIIIQHIQVFDDLLIRDLLPGETHHLIIYRERIPHSPVCLLSNYREGILLIIHTFFLADLLQKSYHLIY